ncbi:MAG: low molecular weight phosphotyrosine protein phosphatase [Verrucomicrobiaceae bacterium]|jgi:protein-tyrosine phosphatase|nr:low molecular weight phosphotyrosine protein phosphatase [Verrucomicrobiaceae bacterium]
MPSPVRVLFVCLGNICRSPAAEGVFRHLVHEEGLAEALHIDSAGTADWHSGKLPDERMRQAGKARGYDFSSRARQARAEDLQKFDLILAMDAQNHRDLLSLDPQGLHHTKIRLFRDFCTAHETGDVPDPYYGGPEGFENVLDLLEDGCAGVLSHARGLLSRS